MSQNSKRKRKTFLVAIKPIIWIVERRKSTCLLNTYIDNIQNGAKKKKRKQRRECLFSITAKFITFAADVCFEIHGWPTINFCCCMWAAIWIYILCTDRSKTILFEWRSINTSGFSFMLLGIQRKCFRNGTHNGHTPLRWLIIIIINVASSIHKHICEWKLYSPNCFIVRWGKLCQFTVFLGMWCIGMEQWILILPIPYRSESLCRDMNINRICITR